MKINKEDYLFGLITEPDFGRTLHPQLGWKRTRWINRLYTLKRDERDNYIPYQEGEPVHGFRIGENYFFNIINILHNELKDIIKMFFEITELAPNNYYVRFTNYIIKNKPGRLFHKPEQLLKITNKYIQRLSFDKKYIKYNIDNKGGINFIIPEFKTPKDRENYLVALCEALDQYYYNYDDKDNFIVRGDD